jgi:hypothetical protein
MKPKFYQIACDRAAAFAIFCWKRGITT